MSQNVNNSLLVKTLLNLQNKVDELSNKLDNIPTGSYNQTANDLGLKMLSIPTSAKPYGATIDANNKLLISLYIDTEKNSTLYNVNIQRYHVQLIKKNITQLLTIKI